MTRRATFTKADLARAVRVADELGKVALWTPQGILFAEAAKIAPAVFFAPHADQFAQFVVRDRRGWHPSSPCVGEGDLVLSRRCPA